ncbi:MAG: arginine--tRNA ligase [Burkholderiales bacterium]|nr:arginine--tRNA ligase [Burkholderiales bacterium]
MQITLYQQLEQKFRTAFNSLGIDASIPIVLQESSKPEFGDYQVNGAMAAAKTLKMNPRELAQKIIDSVDLGGIADKLEIAGPGFINITLNNQYLSILLADNILMVKDDREHTIVVDYSAPNLAKEMHVGHLRSTVIGDALVRIYEFLGNKVIRRNHVGDWGTQFGMLTAYLFELNQQDNASIELHDLEEFYRKSKVRFDEDADFANRAREFVVRLQSGDEQVLALWQQFVETSLGHCQEVCDRLGTKLTRADAVGESSYNDLLAPMVLRLMNSGIAIDSEGAKCVFLTPEELGSKDETPFIIQKKDGGYLYATTDIAAVYDRVNNLGADRLVYVIDARQSLHLKQLFVVSKKAGIAPQKTKMEHSAFGTMMGEDGKPFKTRSGGTVKLIDLINEAIERAETMIRERNPEWAEEDVVTLAKVLGVASMKYADLSKNRLSDYIFSFDKMLAFDGNTAPYLLYAYTRINSIFNKAGLKREDYLGATIVINEFDEHRLAVHIAKFAEKLHQTAKENYPHYLCGYIYELAGLFMKFYESCPILRSDVRDDAKHNRLALTALAGETLKLSLDLLGIPVVERM